MKNWQFNLLLFSLLVMVVIQLVLDTKAYHSRPLPQAGETCVQGKIQRGSTMTENPCRPEKAPEIITDELVLWGRASGAW